MTCQRTTSDPATLGAITNKFNCLPVGGFTHPDYPPQISHCRSLQGRSIVMGRYEFVRLEYSQVISNQASDSTFFLGPVPALVLQVFGRRTGKCQKHNVVLAFFHSLFGFSDLGDSYPQISLIFPALLLYRLFQSTMQPPTPRCEIKLAIRKLRRMDNQY